MSSTTPLYYENVEKAAGKKFGVQEVSANVNMSVWVDILKALRCTL